MEVLKFGGTSVGSAERMQGVYRIIKDGKPKVIVLSAMSGTTNSLVEINEALVAELPEKAYYLVQKLHDSYIEVVNQLIDQNSDYYLLAKEHVERIFSGLKEIIEKKYRPSYEKVILAQGELLSSHLFYFYSLTQGAKIVLLPALEFMRKDANDEPDLFFIKQGIQRLMNERPSEYYVTQGFICLDKDGKIDNLNRGGSDYTASLIGAAIKADNIQIWTDIDGFHNNDPRVVSKTKSISQLSFDEAAELAYFGAKILHPMTILPARELNIPVLLKNTMQPDAKGTYIVEKAAEDGIKAIAAKDGITAIKVKSARMLLAHGFLKEVFEVFDRYKTSIDMITTSEVAVSLSIDDATYLDEIFDALKQFGEVEIDRNQTIVCVVGQNIVQDKSAKDIFSLLRDIDIRMISYGGSRNNISLLIDEKDKQIALSNLNEYIFSLAEG